VEGKKDAVAKQKKNGDAGAAIVRTHRGTGPAGRATGKEKKNGQKRRARSEAAVRRE